MDKFLYRFIFQTIFKFVFVTIATVLIAFLPYIIFLEFFGSISPVVDYWIISILILLASVISCFFIIFVKDNYKSVDTTANSVGKFWDYMARHGKKIHWFWLKLLILPLLALAVYSGYRFYINHNNMLDIVQEYYAVNEISGTDVLNVALTYYRHFINIVATVFFLWQWQHVRRFIKAGKCDKCGAAFALGYYSSKGTTEKNEVKFSKKGRKVVVGSTYETTYLDGISQGTKKTGDLYGTEYDVYQTNIHTETTQTIYGCPFCNNKQSRFDSSYRETKKKIK